MSEAEKQRFCRRCLLREVPEGQALAEIVAERIALMPGEQRVSPEDYEARLTLCRSCDHLVSGTCVLCGC